MLFLTLEKKKEDKYEIYNIIKYVNKKKMEQRSLKNYKNKLKLRLILIVRF